MEIVIIVVHALFLSTLSLRRATGYGQYCIRAREISIHALLAESDSGNDLGGRFRQRFLSTLSLRRATNMSIASNFKDAFLSTLSLRRATVNPKT